MHHLNIVDQFASRLDKQSLLWQTKQFLKMCE